LHDALLSARLRARPTLLLGVLSALLAAGLVTVAPGAQAADPAQPSGGDPAGTVIASDLADARGKVDVFVKTSGEAALETRTRLRRRGASASDIASSVTGRVRAIERTTDRIEAEARRHDSSAATLYTTQYAAAGVALHVDADALTDLAAQPGVERISRIALWSADDGVPAGPGAATGVVTPQNATTDALAGALDAWHAGHTGKEGGTTAVVAVLDTGLDYTHADFGGTGTAAAYNTALAGANGSMTAGSYDASKVIPGHDFAGATYGKDDHWTAQPDENPIDGAGGGHGTHVAGTVAGYGVKNGMRYSGSYVTMSASDLSAFSVGPGLAPDAKILPLKIFGDGGGSTALGCAALEWIAGQVANNGQHVDVASMSIGSNLTGLDECTTAAVERLMDNGVLVVIAAGNSNDITDVGGAPGIVAPALTVAASDASDRVASFSSRGVHGSFENTVKPDVTAPGVEIVSARRSSQDCSSGTCVTKYDATMSGTSMATPAVSGVAALVRAAHPTWSALRLKAQIMNTAAHDVRTGTTANAPARVGTGRVDAVAAVGSDVWARSTENDKLVTASFGVVEVASPVTQTRTVTLTSTGTSSISYAAAYVARDTMPGVTYTLDKSTVTVPAGGTATVTVTLQIDPAALRRTRDTTMAATTQGVARQYVADASGMVRLSPLTSAPGAKELRVAVYAAPKPVSDMHGTVSYVAGSTEGVVSLAGTGVDQGTGTERFASLVAPLVLGATSPVKSGSASDVQTAASDLRAVGASTTAPQLTDRSQGVVTFGVATEGPWAHLFAWNPDLTVHVDTDGDKQDDYRVTLTQHTNTSGYYDDDQIYVVTTKVAGGTQTTLPLDGLDATRDTNQFDTNVALLPVRLSALGFTANAQTAPLRYRVTLGADSAPSAAASSSSGWVDFDAYDPAAWFGSAASATGTTLFPDTPGSFPVHRLETTTPLGLLGIVPGLSELTRTFANPGILLLHLHNASGHRSETATAGTTLLAPPTVTGVGRTSDYRVGDALVATAGAWTDSNGTSQYAWLRDGTPIEGATAQDYVPVLGDAGHTLAVRVTRTSGGVGSTATSAGVAVRLGRPSVVSSPFVTGTPALGRTLTADVGAWHDADGVTDTYAWLRDGSPILGGDGPTHVIVAQDVGHRLQVSVTRTRAGLAATAVSGTVTAATGTSAVTLRSSSATVRYGARGGTTLDATVVRTGQVPGTVTFLDGTRVLGTAPLAAGATGARWTLPKTSSVGRHTLTARFAPAPGSGVLAAVSPGVALHVRKARATARLSVRAKRHGKARVVVRVAVPGTRATGRWLLEDRGRLVTAGRLKKGKRAVTLRHLAAGRHRFRVVYRGSATVTESTSKPVRLRVRH